MSKVDIFSEVSQAPRGEFFKFSQVGDKIQGTYIAKSMGVDSYNNQQIIYSLKDANGKIWSVGLRTTAEILHKGMEGVKLGQIVGFRFDRIKEAPKNNEGKKTRNDTKIILIYADPKIVDREWLSEQQGSKDTPMQQDFFSNMPPPEPPQSIKPLQQGNVQQMAKPQNEAVDAIDAVRNLAKSKGLVDGNQSTQQVDSIIRDYTGLELAEENLTKIIISLTSYSGSKKQ